MSAQHASVVDSRSLFDVFTCLCLPHTSAHQFCLSTPRAAGEKLLYMSERTEAAISRPAALSHGSGTRGKLKSVTQILN